MTRRLLTEAGGTSAWRRRREEILRRDGYECQLGGRRCTGEATCVDHIVERRNGGPDDAFNLRAACHNCNSDRNRNDGSFLGGPNTLAAVAELSLPDPPEEIPDPPELPPDLTGSSLPRLATPRPPGESRGSDLADLAELVGLPLLPWQRHVADQAHVVDDEGRWASPNVLLLCARQNGKTHLLAIRVLAGLFVWKERSILALAQNRSLSRDLLTMVADLAHGVPELADRIKSVRLANGQESITTTDGCRLRIAAATPAAARGLSIDTLLVDEVRELRDESVYAAFAPTTIARPNPQIWYTSNAGDAGSVVLNRLRETGLQHIANGDPSFSYMEWSAPPESGLFDPDGWVAANPALGHTIRADALFARARHDPPAVVRTEALCQWVDVMESPWPTGAWESCQDGEAQLDPARRTVLGLDVSPDRRIACVVAVQEVAEDSYYTECVEVVESDRAVDDLALAGVVAEHARRLTAETVVFDRWTASHVAARLASAGIATVDGSGQEFSRACDDLLTAMVGQRIVWSSGVSGSSVLTNHIGACARTPSSDGGWRIVRRKSTGHVTAAVALAMALHRIVEPKKEPIITVG